MEDQIRMRLEFDIAAQKCINQIIINNELVQNQLQNGIKRAFERFDFEQFVENATVEAIKSEITESTKWGKLRDLVRSEADKIVEKHIEKQLESLKKNLE